MVPFDMILRHPERHSQAVMHDFLHTPEFCAACHKANFPATLNDYKFIRAFTAYDEWQQSKFSQRNPLTFYQADFTTCQGCHMKRNANLATRLRCKEWHPGLAPLARRQHRRSFLLWLRRAALEDHRIPPLRQLSQRRYLRSQEGERRQAHCPSRSRLLYTLHPATSSKPTLSSRTRTSATR